VVNVGPIVEAGAAMTVAAYDASLVKRIRKRKRIRATKTEMEERAEFLIDYANQHGPVTVRGLYYQAEVHELPGISKEESSYAKIQRQVLNLRRQGRLDYDHIADSTRWMRKPRTFNSIEQALRETAALYRKSLWANADARVEVWCEKAALAGVIYPITSLYNVPLMVTNGYSSETFCYEAIAAQRDDHRPYHVYSLVDFDRAGQDAARSLKEKLQRFADEEGIEVIFETIAVTHQQVTAWNLPTREPKRKSAADRRWPYDFACELDAIAPDLLRDIVTLAIEQHLPRRQFEVLKTAEASEREIISRLVRDATSPTESAP
jgi:hypothetical protein